MTPEERLVNCRSDSGLARRRALPAAVPPRDFATPGGFAAPLPNSEGKLTGHMLIQGRAP
jgi:hypothetical protein